MQLLGWSEWLSGCGYVLLRVADKVVGSIPRKCMN